MSTILRPAVFLDRDGTLIEDRGHLRSPAEVVFFPPTAEAMRLLQERFLLFIVTNQPGVAEGVLTSDQVQAVNRHVVERLAEAGVHIQDVYYCPHRRSEGCRCIKPNAHFLHLAARQHGVDLARSFVIGDHPHDVALAANAGAEGIYLLTGHGLKHRADLPAGVTVLPGILEAAAWAMQADECRGRCRQPAGLPSPAAESESS